MRFSSLQEILRQNSTIKEFVLLLGPNHSAFAARIVKMNVSVDKA
jgi:hypothetical protein